MQLIFLGTGSHLGLPRVGCRCGGCAYMFEKGGKNFRTRSSLLVSDRRQNIMIDASPDIHVQLLRERVMQISAILISHSHRDAITGLSDIQEIWRIREKPVPVYASADTWKVILSHYKFLLPYMRQSIIEPGKELVFGDIRITAFNVEHEEPVQTLGFVLQQGKRKVVYVSDARRLPDLSIMQKPDLLIIDGCGLKPSADHMSIYKAAEYGRALAAKRTLFTHIGHGNLPQDLLEIFCEREFGPGFEPAYDGLKIQI
jgi:phosphoribosyl 1,2-cyclic phosphate phosphodiesterase